MTLAKAILNADRSGNLEIIVEDHQIRLSIDSHPVLFVPVEPRPEVAIVKTNVVKLGSNRETQTRIPTDSKAEARNLAAFLRNVLQLVSAED